MTLEKAFDNFIFSKKLQGCSEKTIICYKEVIIPFIQFIGCDLDLEDLTREKYNSYLYELTLRKYSKATLSTYVRQIKVFLNWIEDEYGLRLSVHKIKVPRTHRRLVHIYTDEELRMIFENINASPEWIRLRNCSMVALMLDSGLRQNEVATLKADDIYWDNGTLKVLGKGDKERIVPFGNFSRKFMQQYLKMCPYQMEYFFVGRRGVPVSTDSVKHFVFKLSQKLPFEFSSHRLRHNFATNYCVDQYEKYGHIDVYRLMILMGHEDVETTRIYLHHANQIIASISSVSHLDKALKLH